MLVSYKTIGRNIRAARTQAGLTQEQTAERLKISQLHFGRLERGERPASLEQLAQIAQVLDVPTASLLSGCVMGENFSLPISSDARHLSQAVAEAANGCSPKARRLMLALCQEVARSDKQDAGD